ncbi:uncharacterized protein SCHCODRAFT_02731730 [Schizophyllum commune H4-8]|uniref:uncharacterized protein n=1 Tax=Schizophyllum commune (strain H4-8 / FGSC 9210) TaxID=578458 RepID=UPI00215F0807|nr:uncharacterized protein SCHCODRAFT_02731730 [Schizophyllum commune H4-8]KAI5894410.1 hypothetical protein SCHCODRAFT_02731730 [Schizophyllum commune H4-8]
MAWHTYFILLVPRLRCIRPRSFCRLSNITFLLIQSSVTHAPACSLDHFCSAVLECNPVGRIAVACSRPRSHEFRPKCGAAVFAAERAHRRPRGRRGEIMGKKPGKRTD